MTHRKQHSKHAKESRNLSESLKNRKIIFLFIENVLNFFFRDQFFFSRSKKSPFFVVEIFSRSEKKSRGHILVDLVDLADFSAQLVHKCTVSAQRRISLRPRSFSNGKPLSRGHSTRYRSTRRPQTSGIPTGTLRNRWRCSGTSRHFLGLMSRTRSLASSSR